jgi:hypothetical protein
MLLYLTKCILLLISSPIDRFLTFCHFLVTSPYVQNCCSITSPNDFSSIRTPHEIDCILFYHLTKRLFINSYTSRNRLYTILPPHQTTFHQFVHLTKSIVYYSTTSPNDFSSIRTPHEILSALAHSCKDILTPLGTKLMQYTFRGPNDFFPQLVNGCFYCLCHEQNCGANSIALI